MSPRMIHRIFRVYDVVLQAAREDQEGAVARRLIDSSASFSVKRLRSL